MILKYWSNSCSTDKCFENRIFLCKEFEILNLNSIYKSSHFNRSVPVLSMEYNAQYFSLLIYIKIKFISFIHSVFIESTSCSRAELRHGLTFVWREFGATSVETRLELAKNGKIWLAVNYWKSCNFNLIVNVQNDEI